MNAVLATTVQLTDKEKDILLKEILGRDYAAAGNNLPILKKVIGLVGNASDTFALIEIIPKINVVLTGSRMLTAVAASTSVFSILMFPVAGMISIINAYQSGIKMYSYRAIAYTITAWAFEKPIPISSQRFIYNARHTAPVSPMSEINEMHNAWKKASQSVLKEIDNHLQVNNFSKEVFKILLRAMGDNNELKLCELLLKGYESKFSSFHAKAVWKSHYKSIRYPN